MFSTVTSASYRCLQLGPNIFDGDWAIKGLQMVVDRRACRPKAVQMVSPFC